MVETNNKKTTIFLTKKVIYDKIKVAKKRTSF